VPRFLLKTADDPGGVDKAVFDGMLESVRNDRIAFSAISSTVSTTWTGTSRKGRNWSPSASGSRGQHRHSTQQCIVAFGTTDFRAARLRGHACTPARCADAGFPAVLIRDSRRRRRLLRERGTGWKFVQYM